MKFSVKKIFFRTRNRSNGSYEISVSKAFTYWAIALSIFVLFVSIFAGFGLYLFLQIDRGTIFTITKTPENTRATSFDRKLLEDTLEFYTTRDQQFMQYKDAPPPIPAIH